MYYPNIRFFDHSLGFSFFSKYISRFLENFASDNRSQTFHLPLTYIRLVPRNEINAKTGSYLDRYHGEIAGKVIFLPVFSWIFNNITLNLNKGIQYPP